MLKGVKENIVVNAKDIPNLKSLKKDIKHVILVEQRKKIPREKQRESSRKKEGIYRKNKEHIKEREHQRFSKQ